MKTILFILAALAVAVMWTVEKTATASLLLQIGAQRQENSERESLRRERERLRTLQPDAAELTRLQRDAAGRVRHQRETNAREETAAHAPPAMLTVGEWLPPGAWKNRGCATPTATVESMLWAAAGGDMAKLQDLLQFDDATRAKAGQIFAQLPGDSRTLFTSPEHLIAAFTAKSIPMGDAQLVWQHQRGPDDAVACVWITNPDTGGLPESSPPPRTDPNAPPMQPPNRKRSEAILTLHRTDAGWRVIVPARAVNSLAKELSGAGKP